MNASPSKFTFDLDLGLNPDRASFISDAGRASLQQEARALGFAEGQAAGEHSAVARAEQATTAAATALAERAATLLGGLDEARATAERHAVELAATVARKLATALVAAQPAAELEALLTESLASLDGVPHLVIRCQPELADRLRDIATQRIAASGFAGRLIVLGDPEIAIGDGRIEWVDGGLARTMSEIASDIDGLVTSYLAARQPTETSNGH
jgi:flagellar assembly protein FliH